LPATPTPQHPKHRQLPQPVTTSQRQPKPRCLPSLADVPITNKRVGPTITGYNENYNYAFQNNDYQSYGNTSENYDANSIGGGRRLPDVKKLPASSTKK
jgi:hypothetical protein